MSADVAESASRRGSWPASWLRSPHLPWHLALLSAVLTLPALWVGWHVDDWFHQALLRGVQLPAQTGDRWAGLFDFMGGDPTRTAHMRDGGFVPWWLPEGFQVRFFRPVTVATHLLDHLVMPTSAAFAHAHSIAWSAALVALVTLLYRQFHGLSAVAGLAALAYAVDESRGVPVGWIANRSALVAVFFGVATLLAHDRWRRADWTPGRWLGPLFFALALLSAEAGLATTAYLFGHALFMDTGTRTRRLARLLPFAALVVVWRLAYSAAGFGASGSGLYIDPVVHPVRFAIAAGSRLPVLLAAQWTSLPSMVASFMPPLITAVMVAGAVTVLVGVTWLLRPILRTSATARMWTTGMVLAAIPICATFPANRLLGFVALGGSALLGELAQHYGGPGLAWLRSDAPRPSRRWPGRAVSALVFLPLLTGLVALPAGTYAITGLDALLFGPCDVAVSRDAAIADKTVVFVNSNALCVGYMPVGRIVQGVPAPHRVRLLASAIYEVHVTGVDAHSLQIRAIGGYHSHPADQLMRSYDDPLPIGATVAVAGMQVEVLRHTASGLVDTVLVRFDKALDDPSLVWVATRDLVGGPFQPPRPGQTVILPAAF